MATRNDNLIQGVAPKEKRCNSVTQAGARCRAPKLHGLDFCRRHVPRENKTGEIKSAPSMPLQTLEDVHAQIADAINKVRNGTFTPQQGATLSSLFGRLQEGLFEKLKNDPKSIAARTFTEATARRLAESMDIRTAKEIATNRGGGFIKALVEETLSAQNEVLAETARLELAEEAVRLQERALKRDS